MLRNIADIYTRQGHEIHILAEKRMKPLKDKEILNGVHVHRYSYINIPKIRVFSNPYSLSKSVRKILKEHKIDIVVGNSPWYDGYICTKIAKKMGIPSILIAHCPFSTMSVFNGIFSKKALYAVNNCDKIMAVSRFVKKDAVEKFGIEAKKIFVNYHGIEKDFGKKSINKSIKNKYGLEGNYPIITCLSRFGFPQKRQDILIRSGEELKNHFPDTKLVFIGSGNSSIYQNIAEDEGVGKMTLFLESLDRKDVIDLLKVTDIFAFPTEYEGFGIVTIEAMALGLPIIASNVPPLDEIIKDNYNGRLVNNTPQDFANGIIEILRDKRKMRLISKNAKISSKEFTWGKTAKRLENEMKTLLVKA